MTTSTRPRDRISQLLMSWWKRTICMPNWTTQPAAKAAQVAFRSHHQRTRATALSKTTTESSNWPKRKTERSSLGSFLKHRTAAPAAMVIQTKICCQISTQTFDLRTMTALIMAWKQDRVKMKASMTIVQLHFQRTRIHNSIIHHRKFKRPETGGMIKNRNFDQPTQPKNL